MTLLLVAGMWLGLAALACVMVRYCQNEDRRSGGVMFSDEEEDVD